MKIILAILLSCLSVLGATENPYFTLSAQKTNLTVQTAGLVFPSKSDAGLYLGTGTNLVLDYGRTNEYYAAPSASFTIVLTNTASWTLSSNRTHIVTLTVDNQTGSTIYATNNNVAWDPVGSWWIVSTGKCTLSAIYSGGKWGWQQGAGASSGSSLPTGALANQALTHKLNTGGTTDAAWRKLPVVDEFFSASVSPIGLVGTTANSGVAAANYQSDGQELGIVSVATGTLTNGASGFRTAVTGGGGVLFGTNTIGIRWRIKLEDLSTGVEAYDVYAGLIDSAAAVAPTDGAYFYYTHTVSNGVWTARTVNNTVASIATGASSTVTVAADVWYDLELIGNKDRVDFWVSANAGTTAETWTWIGATTVNIPSTAGRETAFGAHIDKQAGSTGTTSRFMYFGRCSVWP